MQDFARFLRILLEDNKALQVALVALTYILIGFYFVKTEAGRRLLGPLLRPFRLLFYFEPAQDSSFAARRRLIELEAHVDLLRKSLSDKNLQTRREAIQLELEGQLSKELPDLVKRKLEEIKALETAIDPTIRTAVQDAVGAYLDKYSPSDMLTTQRERMRLAERAERANILEQTVEEQMRSAGRLKAVMINLFVLFNIGVLAVYLFAASSLSDRAVTAIIGLYVSLAAFIVYIYRTSNFRSSVLLALREDAKKYFDADEYLRRLKPGASPTDRDVEVLKLLMLNRSEREKMADHPYELVLKGVTNSNIQFKGGKIIPSSKTEK